MNDGTGAVCLIEVTAGIIPGQPDPARTMRWAITSGEWESTPDPVQLLRERGRAADAYATQLRNPADVNWVRTDWVWV